MRRPATRRGTYALGVRSQRRETELSKHDQIRARNGTRIAKKVAVIHSNYLSGNRRRVCLVALLFAAVVPSPRARAGSVGQHDRAETVLFE